jgi:DNA mismatch repair protein MutS2
VLMLLDEVAGGTDPDEGAALAVALLQAFTHAGASVATTTHYERLKQLGAREGGRFRNASVGFDLEAMRPTFRVTLGVPGASSALVVAERYGIPEEVLAAARAAIPRENRDQQRLIQQLERELERAVASRQANEALLAETERRREAMEREREHVLRSDRQTLEKLSAELTKEVQTARADLRRAKALLGTGTKEAYREAEFLVSGAAMPITVHGSLTRALNSPSPPLTSMPEAPVQVGTVVRLLNLNTEAVVVEAPNKGQVRVSVGGLKMTVALDQVQTPKKPTGAKGAKVAKVAVSTPQRAQPRRQEPTFAATPHDAVRTAHNTCDLRGVRVDDGLILVDQFLDEMLRMREPAAFILHGHGTGAMKSAVRQHLAGSRVVRHFEPAPQNNGGDAFTIAWLS